MDSSLDINGDYHSISVLMKTYLNSLSFGGRLIETPQQMYMRISSQLWFNLEDDTSIDLVLKCYEGHRLGRYVDSSPTMFNAGTTKPQMASCFLQVMYDFTESILESYEATGLISKNNGASGISLTNLRSGTPIGNGGLSEGIKPVIRVIDYITAQIHQGRTKRPGATQMTLDIFHIDTYPLIDMCAKNAIKGESIENAHVTLYTHYLLYERLREDGDWNFFCPSDVPMLCKTHGREWRSGIVTMNLKDYRERQ
jgi:ribonucleoside-diphosphate reductase subunit M1